MSELKSCPFCGEMPRIIEHEYDGASNTYGVRCRCGAQSFQFYEEPSLAANAWNARKGEPSADVEPVRHGRWEVFYAEELCGYRRAYYVCSNCFNSSDDEFDYCPNCGARMDGEQDE